MTRISAGNTIASLHESCVTFEVIISKYIEWANCVNIGEDSSSRDSWRQFLDMDLARARTDALIPKSALAPFDRSGKPRNRIPIREYAQFVIQQAERIRDCPLWQDPLLPPFGAGGQPVVGNRPLIEAATIHLLHPSSKEYRRIYAACSECINQHKAIQKIKRFLLSAIDHQTNHDEFYEGLSLDTPIDFEVIDPDGRASLRPRIPEIYRLFLDAFKEGVELMRIKICVGCKNIFWAKPSHQEVCSGRCRVRKHRKAHPETKRDRTGEEGNRAKREFAEDKEKRESKRKREREKKVKIMNSRKRAPRLPVEKATGVSGKEKHKKTVR